MVPLPLPPAQGLQAELDRVQLPLHKADRGCLARDNPPLHFILVATTPEPLPQVYCAIRGVVSMGGGMLADSSAHILRPKSPLFGP